MRRTYFKKLLLTSWITLSLCLCFIGYMTDNSLLSGNYYGGRKSSAAAAEKRKAADENLTPSIPEWDGVGEGQTRLLYRDYEKVTGHSYVPRNQGNAPTCVGQAAAAAVDILAHVQALSDRSQRGPPAPACSGVIYGLSRIEIGGLDPKVGGGSHCLWSVQALYQYGVVARLNYPFLGQDLRLPDSKRAIAFGDTGIPIGLELVAKLHPVSQYISIDSYEEARDCIYMGCPLVVGSSQGFGSGQCVRDKDGFLNPPRWRRSTWNHAMCVIAVCDTGRKGVLILNSWGPDGKDGWVKGPKRFGNEPSGSFWCDKKVFEKMIGAGDTFALRGFEGYRDYRLFQEYKIRKALR